MSEKKGLKQSRLPFQILTSPKVISTEQKTTDKSSPKTPSIASSRKRKQSNEGDNLRLSKIGRRNSKENVAEQEPIEIIDSSNDEGETSKVNDSIISNKTETTPTTLNSSAAEVRKIKICKSASKRKQLFNPIVQDDPDDSVVYICEEDIQSLKKKSKSAKKKGNKSQVNAKSAKKFSYMDIKENGSDAMEVDDNDAVLIGDDKDKNKSDDGTDKSVDVDENNVDELTENSEKEKADFEESTAHKATEDLVECPKVSNDENSERLKIDSEVKAAAEELPNAAVPNNENMKESTALPISQSNNDSSQIKDCKIVLEKVSVPQDSEVNSSKYDSDITPKIDTNEQPNKQTKSMSDEITKLLDNDDNSPNRELQDDIADIITDDDEEKKSPTSALAKTTPKLTPKALARRKELEIKRVEKEMQRQKEKEDKEKQRLKEKEMREEVKRKEREDKEEMRKREKEEREKKKQAELEKKEEEKRQKEEERKRALEQKEEERRAKEEERRQKEEEKKRQNEAREEEKKKKELEKTKEEERKKKAAEAFSKFFVPSKKKTEPQNVDDEASKESAEISDTPRSNFMPFQIHGKMRLAPRIRNEISKKQKDFLDEILGCDNRMVDVDGLYLKQLKVNGYVVRTGTKTWPDEEEEKDDDIVIIDELEGVGEDIKEDEAHLKMKHRAKLLLFEENRRPAYYGTWRKKSKSISARTPFAQDPKFFDYEVDSDEEWEEEEPGESLHGSDSEKEKEKEDDDYEVDDDFFVPHGHLSEDEMQQVDEIMEDNSPETQKAKLKVLQQEFAAEMKKKTEKIKPRLIGCIWLNGDEDEDGGSKSDNLEKKYHCSDIIWRILKAREMMSSGDEIKMENFEPEICESDDETNNSNNDEKAAKPKTPAVIKARAKLEGESVRELIRLSHGNLNNRKFLVKEYQAYRLKNYHKLPDFQEFLFKTVEEKFLEIAEYKTCRIEGSMFGKKCWYVKEDVMKEFFGDEQLPLPNQWTYTLEKENKTKSAGNANDTVKKTSREVSPKENDPGQSVPESPKPINSLKITDFVKSSPKNQAIGVMSPKTPVNSKTLGQNKSATPVSSLQKPEALGSSIKDLETPGSSIKNPTTPGSIIKNPTTPVIQNPKTPNSNRQNPTTPLSSQKNSATSASGPKKPSTPVSSRKTLPSAASQKPVSTINVKPQNSKITTASSSSKPVDSGKKRVPLLMSVKPGQSIDVAQKNLLVNNFIKINQNKPKTSDDAEIIKIID